MHNIINNSQVKVVKTIFVNPGINLRGIIEKTKLSPNYVSKYVNLLVKKGAVREERLKKKRVYLRRFFLDLRTVFARNFFMLIKEEEKEIFFEKYRELRPAFEQIISEIKGIEFIIIYGSYARLTAEKESDIDILIAGDIKNKDKIREILVSLKAEPSIKIETVKDFKKRANDSVHKQITKEGIVIFDSGKFINVISKNKSV